uniref:Tryptophan synthase beta chain-like PALP domain-containing protein n=1 Tax=Paramoeba aestuarina TaxID=180227 RepID=A0A7S4NKV9_9EUKA|mmetsp:Transcript_19404/g.30397  ORF Transcript_19404/g.30397 Transcript_19404/m.30397 type:complete len:501 (+) Transcript_19404:110-1612(+)
MMEELLWDVLWWFLVVIGGVVVVHLLLLFTLMQILYKSIKPAKPSHFQESQKEQLTSQYSSGDKGNAQVRAIFKYVPKLREEVAWIPLTSSYPTPVHTISLPISSLNKVGGGKDEGEEEGYVEILLKREDMSSYVYGGNKVRTLEFQLPCAYNGIREEISTGGTLMVVGGPGSNQCVAVSVYSQQLKDKSVTVKSFYCVPEAPSFDNGLNMMSVLSFDVHLLQTWYYDVWKLLPCIFSTVVQHYFTKGFRVMPGGGANPVGALGHVGAILEICEALGKNHPKTIFLPIGSGCTISGLVVGIAIARKLGLGFEGDLKEYKLKGVVIHQITNALPFFAYSNIKGLVRDTAKLIKEKGDLDVTEEAKEVLSCVEIITGYAGSYGQETENMLLAREIFNEKNTTIVNDNENIKKPWLCSCFSGKAAAAFLYHLKNETKNHNNKKRHDLMLWCTKSLIQPVGENPFCPSSLKGREGKEAKMGKWLSESKINTIEDCKPVFTEVRQ